MCYVYFIEFAVSQMQSPPPGMMLAHVAHVQVPADGFDTELVGDTRASHKLLKTSYDKAPTASQLSAAPLQDRLPEIVEWQRIAESGLTATASARALKYICDLRRAQAHAV